MAMPGQPLRLVLDTNVVASALLWGGTPRLLLQAARDLSSQNRATWNDSFPAHWHQQGPPEDMMKKSRFSVEQIVAALKQTEMGMARGRSLSQAWGQ